VKAVNIAARLQSIANEAEILISAETFHKLQHQIDAEMLPPGADKRD
jgi:class 3 adenylate cyclase